MLICFKITRIYQNNTNHDRVVMSNTVDMTQVEKYFISLLRKATKLSSRTSGQVVSTRQTELSSGKCISLVTFIVL